MKQRLLVALSLVAALGLASCTGAGPATSTRGVSGSAGQSNPPIKVTLEKIGVHHNGESGLRSVVVGAPLGSDERLPGEVYAHVVVTDGKATSEVRLPSKEGEYYELKPDEIVTINRRLLYTSSVGDSLTISVIGYEADGEGFERLVTDALGMAIESQMGSSGILERFNVNLGDLIRKFTGAEHDFMGSYERTFTKAQNWGIGTYSDIPCKVDGETRLRLWFTIERTD